LRIIHFDTVTNFTKDNFFIDAMTDSETYRKAQKDLEQAIENYDKASKDEMHYQTYKISNDIARHICPRLLVTHVKYYHIPKEEKMKNLFAGCCLLDRMDL